MGGNQRSANDKVIIVSRREFINILWLCLIVGIFNANKQTYILRGPCVWYVMREGKTSGDRAWNWRPSLRLNGWARWINPQHERYDILMSHKVLSLRGPYISSITYTNPHNPMLNEARHLSLPSEMWNNILKMPNNSTSDEWLWLCSMVPQL